MRVAGILGIAVLVAGAAALALVGRSGRSPAPVAPDAPAVSRGETPAAAAPVRPPTHSPTPPAPAPEAVPEARWSDWSEPVKGLSCRALLPRNAPRGERLPVTVEFRVDPVLLPAGKKYISLRVDQSSLVLRRRGVEASDPVTVDCGFEKVLETPVLEETPVLDNEGVESPPRTELEQHPDWIPLADAVGTPREFRFSLARAWDALVPGEWEARFEIDASGTAEYPSLWSGTLASVPVPLVIEEPPPLRMRILVPNQLRVRRGGVRGSVEVGFDEGDGEFVDLEPRKGFSLGTMTGSGGGVGGDSFGPSWEGFAFADSFDRLDREEIGPLDRTYEIEIWEAVMDSDDTLLDLMMSRTARRTLWKKSYRVTATAAEIEALRR